MTSRILSSLFLLAGLAWGQGIATTTTLTSSPNPSAVGQMVTLTASVTVVEVFFPFTGTVTFSDGVTTLGTVASNSSGTTTLNVSTLAAGSHSLTAVYSGDAHYSMSTRTTTQPAGC